MSRSIQYTAGHLCNTFEEFILTYEAMSAKNKFDLLFGCKLDQSDPIVIKLKLDMSCHLLNVYTKFQIDVSKHVEKVRKTRTDGRKGIATA